MSSTHIFIISWAGQHENAVAIAKQVLNVTPKVSIVYSDPDPNYVLELNCNLIKRPNELFWGDKFKACLDACGNDGMLVIHADCTCPDWTRLVQKCHATVAAMPIIGVWSPEINGAPFAMSTVKIAELNENLNVVCRTDAIVFYASPVIINRMRRARYDRDIYGQGIEVMLVTASYARGMVAIIDTSVKVRHPSSTGYSRAEAHQQRQEFIKQLDFTEEIQRRLLKASIRMNGGRPVVQK